MNLKKMFSAIAYKKLSSVDLPNNTSNQHELNGVSAIKEFFPSEDSIKGFITWHYFSDENDPERFSGDFTFYDARAKSYDRTKRSEWRLYYSGDFLKKAEIGDTLVLVRITQNEDIHGLIFKNGSAWLRSFSIVFELTNIEENAQLKDDEYLNKSEIDFVLTQILDEIGIEVPFTGEKQTNQAAEKLLQSAKEQNIVFPGIKSFNECARELIDIEGKDPDTILFMWLTKEEQIFRSVERFVIEEKLQQGFESSDEFISYSLSIHNRRKSRMGQALQNHLEKIFQLNNLHFESQKTTEENHKPDFLFPGQKEYQDKQFRTDLLAMLAAKSTCKERWRQILQEADRIKHKHLCTLDQKLTINQTNEMKNQNIILVIPFQFQKTLDEKQRADSMTLASFIEFIKDQQKFIVTV